MRSCKPTVLLDLDNVLFRTDEFKKDLEAEAEKQGISQKVFWQVYHGVRKRKKVLDFNWFFELLAYNYGDLRTARVRNWFQEVDLVSYKMEGADELVGFLKPKVDLRILTEGDNGWQMEKLRRTGLLEQITDGKVWETEERILVCDDKLKHIPTLVEASKNPNGLVIVDDKREVLRLAQEVNPEVLGVLMNYGGYAAEGWSRSGGKVKVVDSLVELTEVIRGGLEGGSRGVEFQGGGGYVWS